jgi:hypothetical protein
MGTARLTAADVQLSINNLHQTTQCIDARRRPMGATPKKLEHHKTSFYPYEFLTQYQK